jgi:hypothetical protein
MEGTKKGLQSEVDQSYIGGENVQHSANVKFITSLFWDCKNMDLYDHRYDDTRLHRAGSRDSTESAAA